MEKFLLQSQRRKLDEYPRLQEKADLGKTCTNLQLGEQRGEVIMPPKQKLVVSFAEKVGIVDVSYMSETAQRLDAQRSLIFFQKKPHDNVIRLAKEEKVELIESPNPRQEIKTINEKFGKDEYDIIIKNLEDMRASMMDPC